MKWFKHMSNARHDEFITWLRCEHGMEGVGRWWTILEVVSEQMNAKSLECSATHPWVEWSSFLKQKRNKLALFLEQIENKQKIKTTDYGLVLKIEIFKMVELRDNYVKDLQGTCQPPE